MVVHCSFRHFKVHPAYLVSIGQSIVVQVQAKISARYVLAPRARLSMAKFVRMSSRTCTPIQNKLQICL